MNWPKAALIVACAALVLLLATIASRTSTEPTRNGSAGSAIRTEARTPLIDQFDGVLTRTTREEIRTDSNDTSSQGRLAMVMFVVDAQLNTPVSFVASCSDADVDLVVQNGGRLLVTAPYQLWGQGVPLEFDAPLYENQSVTVNDTSRETIKMVPAAQSRVHVIRQGEAVRPIRVVLSRSRGRKTEPIDAAFEVLENGGVAFRHAEPVLAHLYNQEGALIFSGMVRPRSNLWVECTEAAVDIRIVHVDGTPAAGVPVSFIPRPSWAGSSTAVTDDLGRLPVSRLSKMAFELESSRLRFVPTAGQMSGVLVDHRHVEIPESVIRTSSQPMEIYVERTVNSIRFVDRTTGAPIEGVANLSFRVVLEHRPPVQMVIFQDELEDGWMEFPNAVYGPEDGPKATQSIILVAGYEPFVMPPEAYPFYEELQEGLSFRLTPIGDRYWLKVLDLGIPIDAGPLAVFTSDEDREQLFCGDISPMLSYGPFNPRGGPIRVESTTSGLLGIAHASTEADDEYLVELGADVGSIRVENVEGELPPLFCMSTEREVATSQSFNDGRRCVFDRLSPGHYLVGPEEWVRQIAISPEAIELHKVEVLAGQVSVVSSHTDWMLKSDIEGRLLLESAVSTPTLLVAYTLPVAGLAIRETSEEIMLAPDGSYRIFRGSALPKALVAIDRWRNRIRVRGVFEPGGVSTLDEVAVELSTGRIGAEESAVGVSYEHGNEWTGVPIHDLHRKVEFQVHVGSAPVRFAVHRAVDRIQLHRHSDGQEQTIDLSGDAVQNIRLIDVFE